MGRFGRRGFLYLTIFIFIFGFVLVIEVNQLEASFYLILGGCGWHFGILWGFIQGLVTTVFSF